MSDRVTGVSGIEPERRVQARRDADRQPGDQRGQAAAVPRPMEEGDPADSLPQVIAPPLCEQPDPRPVAGGFAAFVAQVLGQPGQKRGLRGGPETLEKARTTYLETEYSGSAERRIPTGVVRQTEV